MVFRSPAKRPRRAAPRLAVFVGLGAAICHYCRPRPAFSVKGKWEGDPTRLRGTLKGDFAEVLEGLGPTIMPSAIKYSYKDTTLSMDNFRLTAGYKQKLDNGAVVDLSVDDGKAWSATFAGKDSKMSITGEGGDFDRLGWEATQSGFVDGLGDVTMRVNHEKHFNVTVVRDGFAKIAGANVDARVEALSTQGIKGRVAAQRKFKGGAEAEYSVENPIGVYDFGASKHRVAARMPFADGRLAANAVVNADSQVGEASYSRLVAGGEAKAELNYRNADIGYNVSFARPLSGRDTKVDGLGRVGVDEDGIWAGVVAKKDFRGGWKGQVDLAGRASLREQAERQARGALRVSNKLGWAELSQTTGQEPKLRMGYEFNA